MENDENKNIVTKVIENVPLIADEKKKFSWLDRAIRWGNRVFLGWWICKKRGL